MILPVFAHHAQRLLAVAATAALVLASGACVRRLPPAPTPARTMSNVADTAAPEGGRTRLVVDVADGPTPVQRYHMVPQPYRDPQGRSTIAFVQTATPLCAASPCTLDVLTGNVLLGFPVVGRPGAVEIELVHVTARPSVYRRALSRFNNTRGGLHIFGIVMTSIGSVAGITGVTLLPIGLRDGGGGLAKAGAITLGAGAAVFSIGIWAMRKDAATYRPGAALHYEYEPAATR